MSRGRGAMRLGSLKEEAKVIGGFLRDHLDESLKRMSPHHSLVQGLTS